MSKCLNCKKYEDCSTGSGLTWPCGAYVAKDTKVLTNADHIRSMTDEELAEILCVSCAFCACHPLDNCPSSCESGVLNWLKQPYKEET